MFNTKLFKLAKAILKFGEINTDGGLFVYDVTLEVGTELYIEKDGEMTPVEDGTYETESMKITVKEGKVESIDEKSEETPVDAPVDTEEVLADETEVIVDETPADPVEDEKDLKIKELEAKIAELETAVADKDEEISSLKSKLETANIEMAKQTKPAFEAEAAETKTEAMSLAKAARMARK